MARVVRRSFAALGLTALLALAGGPAAATTRQEDCTVDGCLRVFPKDKLENILALPIHGAPGKRRKRPLP